MPAEDDIVFLQSFKWKKACARCGKEIPEGTDGFWDKRAKPAKYYHTDCFNANANSPKGSQGATNSISNLTNPHQPSGLPDFDVEENMERWIRYWKSRVNEDPSILDIMPLIVQSAQESYGVWTTKRINKGKQEKV